jgi:uncharacterized membrane protein
MPTTELAWSADLAPAWVTVACVLAAGSLVLTWVEFVRRRRASPAAMGGAFGVALVGSAAVALLLLAVLRPTRVRSRGSLVGPKVVALLDQSRSMALPGTDRASLAVDALGALRRHPSGPRVRAVGFGEGKGVVVEGEVPVPMARASDLSTALLAEFGTTDELPTAVFVVSDGRLDRPALEGVTDTVRQALAGRPVPIHVVPVGGADLPDASVRRVLVPGAAVAHQSLPLRVEVGCVGGLACTELRVAVREHREDGSPLVLASGTAKVAAEPQVIELPITLDRAGRRVLEIGIEPVKGDAVKENDRRFVEIDVARDRVRVLHVAGRPTYDVRALRTWLKSDASIDVVAFFILRTLSDDLRASSDELALIPFPVDELFSVHLSSFDAVVLQDFDARPYDLMKYLPTLAMYVRRGGGLVMVGGAESFVPGHYAGTELASVLPVSLDIDPESSGVDAAPFVPAPTPLGRTASVLGPLRTSLGSAGLSDVGEMPGTNLVDDARPGATVLWTHPSRKTSTGKPMPVLALGEFGDGRSIAITIDGAHRLSIGDVGEQTAGRAHAALWEGLVGWLMRDPRFEPLRVEPEPACVAGAPLSLRLTGSVGSDEKALVSVRELGTGKELAKQETTLRAGAEGTAVKLAALPPGAYVAIAEVGGTQQPGLRVKRDFACELGGDEWADSRADTSRLEALAAAANGRAWRPADLVSVELPQATRVTAERSTHPVAPAWVWTLAAAVALGVSWVMRRKTGLA